MMGPTQRAALAAILVVFCGHGALVDGFATDPHREPDIGRSPSPSRDRPPSPPPRRGSSGGVGGVGGSNGGVEVPLYPSCDWGGTIETYGASEGSGDDFKLTCNDGLLVGFTNNDPPSGLTSDRSYPYCDWTGPRDLDGTNNCDDMVVDCYNQELISIKTRDRPCSDFTPQAYGSWRRGVMCNYVNFRLNGDKGGDDFSFECTDGIVSNIYFRNRRSLSQVQPATDVDAGARVTDSEPQNLASPAVKADKAADPMEAATSRTTARAPRRRLEDDKSPDTCSSWRVPRGYWVQLFASGGAATTYTIEYTTESSDTNAHEADWSVTLSASMEYGIASMLNGVRYCEYAVGCNFHLLRTTYLACHPCPPSLLLRIVLHASSTRLSQHFAYPSS
eukprot:6198678-Pleurochrysis_carterae.AAC.2